MKYQNGMQIDLDNMTYEEMLELEEMGSVSEGQPQEQISTLPRGAQNGDNLDELCSVLLLMITKKVGKLPGITL